LKVPGKKELSASNVHFVASIISSSDSGGAKNGRRRTYAMAVETFGYSMIAPSPAEALVKAVQP
tara:strand:+ start:1071 stop:1262 length:192 start_codon:yes stop_codon:yes gene_type:complete